MVFNYTADKDSLLEIKGVVLEDLNPKSKIEGKVPLTGKIIVVEQAIEEKLPQLPRDPPQEGDPLKAEGKGRDRFVPSANPVRSKKPNPSEGLPDPDYIPINDLETHIEATPSENPPDVPSEAPSEIPTQLENQEPKGEPSVR